MDVISLCLAVVPPTGSLSLTKRLPMESRFFRRTLPGGALGANPRTGQPVPKHSYRNAQPLFQTSCELTGGPEPVSRAKLSHPSR